MSRYIEKIEQFEIPVLPLRGVVAFPDVPISLEIQNSDSVKVCELASENNGYVFLVAQKDISIDSPSPDDLYTVGTVTKIKQFLKTSDDGARILCTGEKRATAIHYKTSKNGLLADLLVKEVEFDDNGGIKTKAIIQETLTVFEEFLKYLPKVSNELRLAAKAIEHPGLLADFIACNILVNFIDKQLILEEYDPMKRAELLCVTMEKELEILNVELSIHKKVRAQIERNQKEYYLKEQLKAIQNELSVPADGGDSDIEEYFDKIEALKLPEYVEEKLVKETKKLYKMPFSSAESAVIKNYLDVCLELPWTKVTKDRIDVASASKVLERDHYGLEKVKERILEFLAVKQLSPDLKNQILCLVGPPGTGKTSVVRSIASAVRRKYVRVSLGGVRDEADIRGHRKTYVASMPGRIIEAIRQAGTKNPVILLDEIDKLTSDSRGDPSSALLEVLDGEQNKTFRDHFVELPIDLSECVFIATANSLDTVARPLIDRMEIIELSVYTRNEKLNIAKKHLISKQCKRHGLTRRQIRFTDSAVFEIIDYYTREAGVRNLERQIASICRKTAKRIVEGSETSVTVSEKTISDFLGPRKLNPEKISPECEVGTVNGLAYTELGGDLLKVEALAVPGSGKIELTGSLGDVMKESARAAISYIRAHADELKIKDKDFYKNSDIHIHVPEGAVPKDGPSAGVTITTALVSELSGIAVRNDVAMTGEITLRGHVLAIGGLKEKTMAAYTAGVGTVIIPEENMKDIAELDPAVRESLVFVPCKEISEVLDVALVKSFSEENTENEGIEEYISVMTDKIPEIRGRI